MKKPLSILLLLAAFAFAAHPAAAQYLNGVWEGVQVTSKKPFPKGMTFDWDNRKYSYNPPQPWTSWLMELHVEGTDAQVTGTWRTMDKYAKNAKPNVYEFEGSYNDANHMLVWQPTKVITGVAFANTINRTMTLLNDGTYEYFEGRWTAQDGTNGILFFRRLPPADPDDKLLKAVTYTGSHPDGAAVNFKVEMEPLLGGGEQPKGSYEYMKADGTRSVQAFAYVMREDNVYTFTTEGFAGNTDTWKVTVNSTDEIVLEFQSVDSSGPITLTKS